MLLILVLPEMVALAEAVTEETGQVERKLDSQEIVHLLQGLEVEAAAEHVHVVVAPQPEEEEAVVVGEED